MKRNILKFAFLLLFPLCLFAQNKHNPKSADIKTLNDKTKIQNVEQDSTNQSKSLKINKIWPNPANNVLHIEYEAEKVASASLEIYNIKGTLVVPNSITYVNSGNKSVDLNDISNLSIGQYEFRLKVGAEQTTGTFQVVR